MSDDLMVVRDAERDRVDRERESVGLRELFELPAEAEEELLLGVRERERWARLLVVAV
jgi:hypothetical protein